MEVKKRKKLVVRMFAALLGLFALLFGGTWKSRGFCFGDMVLAGLGLPAWSNGTQGTHYSAVIGLILLMAAFYLFMAAGRTK